MNRRSATFTGTAVALGLGLLAVGRFTIGSASAAAARTAAATPIEWNYAQVRAEFITKDGNDDVTNTTCTIVNRSQSRTLYLGDISALGLDGLDEILAVHTGLNGIGIQPLGSIDVPVDAAHFPGLQPKVFPDSRGVETILVSWTGPKEALRLSSTIRVQLPGARDTGRERHVDGHPTTK
jgi:hypothetical protein